MSKKQFRKKEIRFDGKLDMSKSEMMIGPNDFTQMFGFRYDNDGIVTSMGLLAVNATALPNAGMKSGIHFQKKFPQYETHLLIAAVDGTGYNQKVYDNKVNPGGTATSEFGTSPVFTSSITDNSVGLPIFTIAPNGAVVFCNGDDTAIWYGDEMPVAGFIEEDSGLGSYKYDYLEQVSDGGTKNFATTHTYTVTIDSNTIMLLHLDGTQGQQGTLTDSGFAADKVVVCNGSAMIGTASGKFSQGLQGVGGTAVGTAYLQVTYHAAFDAIGSSSWAIDGWHRAGTTFDTAETIWSQAIGASDYFQVYFYDQGGTIGGRYIVNCYSGGTQMFYLQSGIFPFTGSQSLRHVAVQHDHGTGANNKYAMWIDGIYQGGTATTNEVPTLGTDQDIQVGGAVGTGIGTQYFFYGALDEFRISNTTRWTYGVDFTPETLPYGESGGGTSTASTIWLASPLPLRGIGFYLGTVNSGTAATPYVHYWNGAAFTQVTGLDIKNAAGSSLGVADAWGAAYEKWAFDDTVSVAKLYNKDDKIAYWYKVTAVGDLNPVTIYKTALDASMQQIQDIWDGIYHPVAVFAAYDNTYLIYNDYSANVFEDSVDAANSATFAKLGGFLFSDDYLYVGSIQQLRGIKIGLQGGFENRTKCTMVVEYWDGATWQVVAATDNTRVGDISFARSSSVTWEPPTRTNEFKTTVSGMTGKYEITHKDRPALPGENPNRAQQNSYNYRLDKYNKLQGIRSKEISPVYPNDLFYYRLSFVGLEGGTAFTPDEATESGISTAGVHVFSVQGIPAQVDCRGYRFAFTHDDSLFLGGNDDSEPNTLIYSAKYDPQIFNGENTGKLYIGDDTPVIAGVSFSNQFGASIVKQALVFKANQVWKVIGDAPYEVHPLSYDYGCVSPLSVVVGEIEYAPGFIRTVAIWASQQGIVYSDGNTISKLSADIDLFFRKDTQAASYYGTNIQNITAVVDPQFNELVMTVGPVQQFIYDFTRKKWSVPGWNAATYVSNLVLSYGTDGLPYKYGCGRLGTMYLIDHGFTNVAVTGTSKMTSYVYTAKLALDDNYIGDETVIRAIKLLADPVTGINGTDSQVYIHHEGDSGNSTNLGTYCGTQAQRVFANLRLGPSAFHQFQIYYVSGTNPNMAWSPLVLSIDWEYAREDIRRD